MPRTATYLALLSAIAAAVAMPAAFADDKPKRRESSQEVEVGQDEVLQLMKRKEFRPLADVLAVAGKAIPGQIVRVKVKRLRGRLAYELQIIETGGAVREVYIDPETLDVLKVE